MSARIESLEMNLHPAQYDFYCDDTYATLFVGGVGSGKTYIGARKALHNAMQCPQTLGLIAANTKEQLNQSTLAEFWLAVSELGLNEGEDFVVNKRPPDHWKTGSRFSGHKDVISFSNGAQIVIRSVYYWRTILGLTLGWAWIDEARDTSKGAFEAILSRLRCKKAEKHQIFLTTTPNGFDWIYDYFEKEPGQNRALFQKRRYYVARTKDNAANLPAEYIEMLCGSFDKQVARQELDGQWIDVFTGKAYYAFDRQVHVTEKAAPIKSEPLVLCCDFNISPMSWLVGQRFRRTQIDAGFPLQDEVLVIFDQIIMNTTSTQEAAQEFAVRGYDLARTAVYGDAAGHHSTTMSDYTILAEAGFTNIHVPRKNPAVLDRVAAMNGRLVNAKNEVGLLIHPRCTELIEDLARVGYKPGTRQLDKSDPARTHTSDAVGYCVARLWPRKRTGRMAAKGECY